MQKGLHFQDVEFLKFNNCFEEIRQNFRVIFRELFGGGKADICLDDENSPLECGIEVIAEPPGKCKYLAYLSTLASSRAASISSSTQKGIGRSFKKY